MPESLLFSQVRRYWAEIACTTCRGDWWKKAVVRRGLPMKDDGGARELPQHATCEHRIDILPPVEPMRS